jgi:hypothetical protein
MNASAHIDTDLLAISIGILPQFKGLDMPIAVLINVIGNPGGADFAFCGLPLALTYGHTAIPLTYCFPLSARA